MKFMYNQNDDLKYAIDSNSLGGHFAEEDIVRIVAEVVGQNDELDWHWIVELKDGKFAYLNGGCDYSGWGCQSDLSVNGIAKSALLAAELAPEAEQYSKRTIRKNLINQVEGKQSFALYQE